jgi:hypothetical protein
LRFDRDSATATPLSGPQCSEINVTTLKAACRLAHVVYAAFVRRNHQHTTPHIISYTFNAAMNV